jgi:hypothetical protein
MQHSLAQNGTPNNRDLEQHIMVLQSRAVLDKSVGNLGRTNAV